MIQQTAGNAAFEAARQCILPGATAADGQTVGQRVLSAASVTGTVTISPATITTTTTSVTVTVTVPVASNLWVPPVFCGSGSVTKSCTMTCDWVYSAG